MERHIESRAEWGKMNNTLLKRMKETIKDNYIHEFKLMDFKIKDSKVVEDKEVVLFGIRDNFLLGDVIRKFNDVKTLKRLAEEINGDIEKANIGEALSIFDALEGYVREAFSFEDFLNAVNEKMSEFFIETLNELSEEEQSKFLLKEYENMVVADFTNTENYCYKIFSI